MDVLRPNLVLSVGAHCATPRNSHQNVTRVLDITVQQMLLPYSFAAIIPPLKGNSMHGVFLKFNGLMRADTG